MFSTLREEIVSKLDPTGIWHLYIGPCKAYRANRATGNETALESSLLYEPLVAFVEKSNNQWEGTMGALLSELNDMIGEAKAKQKGWPTQPRGLRSALQRIVPNLRTIGLNVEFSSNRTNKGSVVKLDLNGKQPSQHTQPSQEAPESDGRDGLTPSYSKSLINEEPSSWPNELEKEAYNLDR